MLQCHFTFLCKRKRRTLQPANAHQFMCPRCLSAKNNFADDSLKEAMYPGSLGQSRSLEHVERKKTKVCNEARSQSLESHLHHSPAISQLRRDSESSDDHEKGECTSGELAATGLVGWVALLQGVMSSNSFEQVCCLIGVLFSGQKILFVHSRARAVYLSLASVIRRKVPLFTPTSCRWAEVDQKLSFCTQSLERIEAKLLIQNVQDIFGWLSVNFVWSLF